VLASWAREAVVEKVILIQAGETPRNNSEKLPCRSEAWGCDINVLEDPEVVEQYWRIIGAGAPGSRPKYNGPQRIVPFTPERTD
jgi:hypothetical protein